MRINGRELDTGDTDRDDEPVDDNVSEYIRFFKVCARERESLQNELKAVCNDKSKSKYHNKEESMKGM